MNLLVRIVAHKLFALSVLVGVGVWLLVIPAFTGGLGANPVEKLLHQTGEIAIWTLGAVLALTPLRILFPRSRLVNALNRHRRMIGVTACIYGLLHFSSHILLRRRLGQPLAEFYEAIHLVQASPVLTILVILALTSNQWSIRKLGGKTGSACTALPYVAAALLIYHQAIAGKGHWYIARWLFFTLVTLELARLAKTYLRVRSAPEPG